jgi:hypothetical protein
MAATCISDLVIQEEKMDLVAGTHGRGIYKMNITPIQAAFQHGHPQNNILFKTPVATLPWFNDTHNDPSRKTIEKVPITFFLIKEGDVSVEIKNKKGDVIWSQIVKGNKGFNQIRWNLVTETVSSPYPYFIHYLKFPKPGTYDLFVTGKDVDFKGELTIVEHPSIASLLRSSQ